MSKGITAVSAFVILLFAFGVSAQQKTRVNDANSKRMLVGKHMFSLQWISWDYFGSATVTEKNGILSLTGEQKSRENDDFIRIDGTIISVDSKSFKFSGTVETRVTHINGGDICTRSGEMTFAIKKNRKYWRLSEMDNPCDEVVDYVDIFFRK